jgi:cytoskeletal protein CcmA (bactofilin family)
MISFGNEVRQEPRTDLREPLRPQSISPSVVSSPAPTPISTATSVPNQIKAAVLGPTLRFKGELSAEEDFILQGSLEGSISNPQCVTIGTEGTVIGDIRARVITVDGKIEGDLHGGESVIVHQTGHVTGNIFAPRVGIIEGAYFSGRIEMIQKGAAQPQVQSVAQAQPVAQPTPRAITPSQLVPGVPLSPEETEKVLAKK